MSQLRDDRDDMLFLWFALLVLIFVVIPALYAAHKGSVNAPLVWLASIQLRVFAPFSEEVRTILERLTDVEPAALTWEQVRGLLRYAGSWMRWPLALLLLLCGCTAIFIGRVGRLVRHFSMKSLLKNNAESFPCLRPVVGRGKYLLSPKSYDSGLWRIARTPVQFALEQELLLNENGEAFTPEQALHNGLADTELPAWGNARLDEDKALAAFQAQLGKPFENYTAMTACRRALAAAFLAYADGDKKGCVAVLDAVSSSYREKRDRATCPVLEQKNFHLNLNRIWERHQSVLSEKSLRIHAAFELPWFMALLCRARKKGVLASSQFLWLRPLDRPLWYALNQCGGRTAWVESLAPWAHYKAEEQAGQALTEPHVALAVTSLKDSLSAQGWLTDIFIPPMFEQSFTPAVEQAEPVSDMVYAAAENDPEYDANDDPSLAEEHY